MRKISKLTQKRQNPKEGVRPVRPVHFISVKFCPDNRIKLRSHEDAEQATEALQPALPSIPLRRASEAQSAIMKGRLAFAAFPVFNYSVGDSKKWQLSRTTL